LCENGGLEMELRNGSFGGRAGVASPADGPQPVPSIPGSSARNGRNYLPACPDLETFIHQASIRVSIPVIQSMEGKRLLAYLR